MSDIRGHVDLYCAKKAGVFDLNITQRLTAPVIVGNKNSILVPARRPD